MQPEQHTPDAGQSSAPSAFAKWWKRPPVRRWLLWSLAHFCGLVLLDNFLFLLSHIPLIHLDGVILLLTDLGSGLRLPARLLRAGWPFETTPQLLNWFLAAANSLICGAAFSAGQRVWVKMKN